MQQYLLKKSWCKDGGTQLQMRCTIMKNQLIAEITVKCFHIWTMLK